MITKEKNINAVMEKYDFFSETIFNKFNGASCKWLSDAYLYFVDNKIVSFLLMMKEDLKCSFLHYHIENEKHREYFIEKYPIINRKTNQVFFIYTEETFRKKNIATKLLEFMFNDLLDREYFYVWLRKETSSQIYTKLAFLNFLDMIRSMNIDSESFLNDYKLKVGYEKESLINMYNDTRLVKQL